MLRGAATQPDLVTAADVRALAAWDPTQPAEAELPFMPARVILQDFTGVPCVVDLAAMRDAMAEMGGDPSQDQPARPRGPRHRPLRPGRRVRHRCRVPHQRRARVRAQRGALRPPALGAAGLRRLPRRAAGDRHRAPGQPRVPRRRRGRARRGAAARHAGRHRLAHHHDQRPRRRRLGRRRHRGRGRAPRPAALSADADRGRLPPRRGASLRRHGHRPRPVRDRDASRSRRGRQVRRVLRPRAVAPRPRRSGDDQQHVARVRRHRHPLPDRRRDAPLPSHDRPAGRGRGARRGVREGPGPLPHRRLAGADLQRVPQPRPHDRRAVPGRPEAPAGSGRTDRHARLVPRRVPERAAHARRRHLARARDRGRRCVARHGRRGKRRVVPGLRPAVLHPRPGRRQARRGGSSRGTSPSSRRPMPTTGPPRFGWTGSGTRSAPARS